MWEQWRRHWLRSNAVALLAAALIGALLATWWLSRGQGPVPAAITQGLVMLGLLLMAATLPHLPWVTAFAATAPVRRLSHVFVTALSVGIGRPIDRKSTRLNSSHVAISYAVFCLKKKN